MRAVKLTSTAGNPTFNQSPRQYERTLMPRSSPECGGSLGTDEYNLGIHVAALFVVLAQSTFGMTARPLYS